MIDKLKKIDSIIEILPQLQCRKCTYDDCKSYATAIIENDEETNKCEPGSEMTMKLIDDIKINKSSNPRQEIEFKIAKINVEDCIGCTLCIKVCPVDAILGAKLKQHHDIHENCNGCELCISQCPTNCMTMVKNYDEEKWIWPSNKSDQSKSLYYSKIHRLENEKNIRDNKTKDKKNMHKYITDAIERESLRRRNFKTYEK